MSSSVYPTADLAPTGRAKCLHCTQTIDKGSVRIAVLRNIDTGSFITSGPGYLHPACAQTWADTNWEDGFADLQSGVRKHTLMPTLPAPFGGEAGSDEKTAAPAVPKEAPPPPFGQLGSQQIEALVVKLRSLKDEYKTDSALEKAGINWADRDELRWHLARNGLIPPTHVSLLRRLAESVLSQAADAVFAVIPKLGIVTRDVCEVMPGWSTSADEMVLRAMQLDPDRLALVLDSANSLLRLGIQLVRGRSGVEIPASDRARILDSLAEIEAKQAGLPRTYSAQGERLSIQALGITGERSEPYDSAWSLAKHFGTQTEWQQALAKHARKAKFSSIAHLHEGLCILPLSQLVTTLSKIDFHRHESSYRAISTLLSARGDDPLQLADEAKQIARDAYPGRDMREILLLSALSLLGQQQREVPEGLELELSWELFSYCVSPWRGEALERSLYQTALRALPKERIWGIIRARFLRDYTHNYALALLSAAYDEALFVQILSSIKDASSLDELAVASLGNKALPTLLSHRQSLADRPLTERQTAEDKTKSLRNLDACVRAVLGAMGIDGQIFDGSHDRWLHIGEEEDYWPEHRRQIFLSMLSGMTSERRSTALRRLLECGSYIERAFLGVHTVADESFRTRAAALLVRAYGSVHDHSLLQRGIAALGCEGLVYFRAALLSEKPDAKLFELLSQLFGREPVTLIQQQANVKTERPLDRLLRLSKEAPGPKQRIYLLEPIDLYEHQEADEEISVTKTPLTVPHGSFSVSRGKGPGIRPAPAAEPGTDSQPDKISVRRKHRSSTGEQEHILTIDLRDIPELTPSHPGARALSLFAANPDHGDGWDAARLVPVPSDATPPSDGSPIAVIPLQIPRAAFDSASSSHSPQIKEIRSLLFNRPGWALGEPIYIQSEEDGDFLGSFLFQLSERMGDLNLGDSGSLYVFSGGTFMQCY